MIMGRLVRTIQALSERDWFDYLAVAAPLILSVVAIWISISTAKKQNKIALFDIRCKALHSINLLLAFGEKLEKCKCDEAIIDNFNTTFGTRINIFTPDPIDAQREALNCLNVLSINILAAKFVFTNENLKLIEEIYSMENDYVYGVIEEGMNEAEQCVIQEKCKKYRHKYLDALIKQMII